MALNVPQSAHPVLCQILAAVTRPGKIISGVTRGTAPGDTLQGGDTRKKKLWANLQRIVDKRGRIGKKVAG